MGQKLNKNKFFKVEGFPLIDYLAELLDYGKLSTRNLCVTF
jgi:hypothetical protein